MIERDVIVKNKVGIHARPAALLVQMAEKYDADIFFEKDNNRVNGRSVLGIMLLAAACNSKVTIIAEGADEAAAVEAIEQLFNDRFGEDNA